MGITAKQINMTDPASRIAELIFKYMRDELSAQEAGELQEWIDQSESNRLFFERYTDEANIIRGLKQYVAATEDSEEVRSKVDALTAAENPVPVHRIDRKRYAVETRVAAAVLILVTAGIYYFKPTHSPLMKTQEPTELATRSTPHGKMDTLVLPDGSIVYLNASSAVRYPKSFRGNQRCVELTGEAFFDVKKDAPRPFIVKTPHGEIKVLGTSFNVNAYDSIRTTTTLIDGKVKVVSPSDSAITLSFPGQRSLDSLGHLNRLRTIDPKKALAWRDNSFDFDDDMPYIMRELAGWYDIEVDYKAKIGVHFIAKLSRGQPLSNVLGVLEKMGPVHFKIEGKKITVLDKINK
jgi:ferric-dicitrate binding protein FerR (iron transport regulator)